MFQRCEHKVIFSLFMNRNYLMISNTGYNIPQETDQQNSTSVWGERSERKACPLLFMEWHWPTVLNLNAWVWNIQEDESFPRVPTSYLQHVAAHLWPKGHNQISTDSSSFCLSLHTAEVWTCVSRIWSLKHLDDMCP